MQPSSSAWPIAAALALVACLEPTPFGTDASERDLNRKNLARLLASERPGPLRFVAIGDTHDEYDDLEETVAAINLRQDVEFVVHAGDLTNLGLLQEFEWTHRVLSQLRMPVLVTIGNHDAISSGKEIFAKMYGPFDHSFTYKQRKFVLFNANVFEFPEAPNRAWLSAELEDLGAAQGAILITHQSPRRPSELPGGDLTAFFAGLVSSRRVTLFINGHLADLEIFDWLGTRALQCGTFEKGRLYSIVSVEGGVVSFEVCRFTDCRAVPALPWKNLEGGVP